MKVAVSILVACLLLVAVAVHQRSPFVTGHDAVASPASVSFTVVNSGTSAYRIDGFNNPDLILTRGETYIFNVSAPGHPFYVKTTPVTGTGNQYNNGVTGQGATSGSLTFVVPNNAPDELFYQCSVHGPMSGSLNIISGAVTVPDASVRAGLWLGPATPNPSGGAIVARFGIPRAGNVRLAVYDVRGTLVRELWNRFAPAGAHGAAWDGRDQNGRVVPAGVYYSRLLYEGRTLTRGIVIRR